MRAIKTVGLAALLIWTLILHHYHMGVLPPPRIDFSKEFGSGEWLPRTQAGINHLILRGTPYTRGLKAGELTRPLLEEQEQILVSQLEAWIPSRALLQMGVAGLIGYFQGADRYIEQDDFLEMYGTAQSAPRGYDFLADPYTRQLAYHGLHEVGQMMVDRGVDMGCTVAAVKHEAGWILGRNFDFEAGRVFDREKVLKWVFPSKGFAHVSVIWAGMVGAVTGVNEKGVYISINAAGSEGFRRIGTPSTLVAYKVLREAENTEHAVQILRDAHMFITDIFVVVDAAGRLVRVEKSPQKTEVIESESPFVVANHLVGKAFQNDRTNEFRRRELTTKAREDRALQLAGEIGASLDIDQKTRKILDLLRDKGRDEAGRSLHLGNHMAIDALIATHSVIFDSVRRRLYVSKGPSLVGEFLGYDLDKSFRDHYPEFIGALPEDPQVSEEFYDGFKSSDRLIHQARHLVRHRRCAEGLKILQDLPVTWREQEPYYHTLGDAHSCMGDKSAAVSDWRKAYALVPAYASTRRDLEAKLGNDMETNR